MHQSRIHIIEPHPHSSYMENTPTPPPPPPPQLDSWFSPAPECENEMQDEDEDQTSHHLQQWTPITPQELTAKLECEEEHHQHTVKKMKPKHSTVIWCEETYVDRPWGGSGDSCLVTRVAYGMSDDDDDPPDSQPRRKRSLIVKRLLGPSRRHMHDAYKTGIKTMSYHVEAEFLLHSEHLSSSSSSVRVPRCISYSTSQPTQSMTIMEDLISAGFPIHVGTLTLEQTECALRYLAHFHLSHVAAKCWKRGTFWSLDKRLEEYIRMEHRWEKILSENVFGDSSSPPSRTLGTRLHAAAIAIQRVLHPAFPNNDVITIQGVTYDGEATSSDDDDHSEPDTRCFSMDHLLIGNPQQQRTPPTQPSVLNPVLIHGDFKAENLFFNDQNTECACCDFQWTGYGVGALDIVFLLSMSLPEPPDETTEKKLLEVYLSTLFNNTVPRRERKLLHVLIDLAIVDYARYVIGTGDVFPEDHALLTRADTIMNELQTIDERYDEAIAKKLRECNDDV